MTGKIIGISGPTVSVDLKGLKLYERVFVGKAMLTGEVVRVKESRTVVQVYENTHGLAVGEPVKSTGKTLTVKLGPGLLSGIFDGLQRPLHRLKEETGPFIRHGEEIPSFNPSAQWDFYPVKKTGESVSQGEVIGYVEEGAIKHFITCNTEGGKLSWISEKDFSADRPVAIIDDNREVKGYQEWAVRVPRPYKNKFSPSEPLITGQRSIDLMFSLAKGGTSIMPGGFGTGKTILEQSVAKFADVDIVVYVGCGERGNEMAELIEEFEVLKDPWTRMELMKRTILVVNTSNMPVAAREASIFTAVTMAEYYRDMGYSVLLLADSISRWAEALREISSSLEEMPGEEGYPTYLSSRLAGFLERAGNVETHGGAKGSLSMIISVSPPGGDFTEPVTQSCLRASGTFLMLDTSLAHRRHFPAVNWFQSYSLYRKDLIEYFSSKVSADWDNVQTQCMNILHKEESLREVLSVIGVEGLQDADRLVIHFAEKIRTEFLIQNAYTEDAFSSPDETFSIIKGILDNYNSSVEKLSQGILIEDILKEK